jgi:hypothetical protein
MQGDAGTSLFDISGPAGVMGTAYVFMSFQKILYITMQFQCAFMFSTQPE